MQHTQDSVTEARVRELLDAYGSDPASWPAQEREAALVIIASSADLQAQQAHSALLDDILRHDQHAALQDIGSTQALQARILAGLPERASHRPPAHAAWQNLLASLFTPRLAFALATFMVVTATVYLQIPPATELASQSGEFEQWAWYDVTGQSLDNQSNTAALSMMDLIELEVVEDDV